ncbi:hypothetical protein JCM1841_005376 [Sporobolomyces salmonicolor]
MKASPFSNLPRLVTASSSYSSTTSSLGGAVSEPLLARSSSPAPLTSSRRSSLSPLSPPSPSPASLLFVPPAARLTSRRRWGAVAAVLLVSCVLLGAARGWSSGVTGTEYEQRVREGLMGWGEWAREKGGALGEGRWTDWGGPGRPQPQAEVDQGPGKEGGETLVDAVRRPTEEDVAITHHFQDPPDLASAAEPVLGGLDSTSVGEAERPEEALSLDEEGRLGESSEEDGRIGGETAPAVGAGAGGKDRLSAAKKLNVHSVPRPPSTDPVVASEVKYLSFENHSGFHNQRKSLVNALTLAHLLNRTLLLPPARLGNPIPWGPDMNARLVFSERCKVGLLPDLPIARSPNSYAVATGEECDDPERWSYVGWEYLVTPKLLEGRQLVDRWNSSYDWFTASLEEGGLGLEAGDIHSFVDDDRRSYQLYDMRSTPTDLGLFRSRIDIPDLLEGPLAQKRLLKFGSLFSGARLNLAKEDNTRVLIETNELMILQSAGLDAISDEVRDRLGSYVAVHARVGGQEKSTVFSQKAQANMLRVFRKLAHDVLGLNHKDIDTLIESTPRNGRKIVPRAFGTLPSGSEEQRLFVAGVWDNESDHDLAEPSPFSSLFAKRTLPSPSSSSSLLPRARSGRPSQPLSPSLHCRRPLYPSTSPFAPLNTPLYIATDSRAPTTDPALRIFFDTFPCAFLLGDFAKRIEGVSEEGIAGLEELVRGGGRWTSEWDGQEMSKYLFPFLEAEIAARGVEVVGTPESTFSGYTAGILHESYVAQGMVAGWNSDV